MGLGPTPDNMNKCLHIELSSHEETRCQFNGGTGLIKFAVGRIRLHGGLGIDVHQNFYVVVKSFNFVPHGIINLLTALF